MHPLYFAFAALAGGLVAFFVLQQNNPNPNPVHKPAPSRNPAPRKRPPNDIDCPVCLMTIASAAYEHFTCSHPIHVQCMKDLIRAMGTNAKCPVCRSGTRLTQ